MIHEEKQIAANENAATSALALASGSALVAWLHEKLADAEKSLSARKQSAECWRDGTSKSWRAVGNV